MQNEQYHVPENIAFASLSLRMKFSFSLIVYMLSKNYFSLRNYFILDFSATRSSVFNPFRLIKSFLFNLLRKIDKEKFKGESCKLVKLLIFDHEFNHKIIKN